MKKLLAAVLALCLLTAAALAAATYETHIGPIEKTFTHREIRTSEEAIAYAQEVWQSDWFAQDVTGFSWYAEEAEVWDEPEWTVYGTLPDAEDEYYFVLSFMAKDGTLVGLTNGQALADVQPAGQDGQVSVIPAEIPAELRDYLLAFNAAAAVDWDGNDGLYAFEFADSNHPEFGTELGKSYQFTYNVLLELAPVTRIVEIVRGWG